MTHNEQQTSEATECQKPIGAVLVSEMCGRCQFRPVSVYRAFRFVDGVRFTVRSGDPFCQFCK